MPQFYVPPEQIKGNRAFITGDEARHIRRVLRMRSGDEIFFFDGTGRIYQGRIIEVDPFDVVIEILESWEKEDESIEIYLAQGIPKGEKMDFIVQKSTELGVRMIFPLITERTIPEMDEVSRMKKIERWRRISIEASKQCGRSDLPIIKDIRMLDSFLSKNITGSLTGAKNELRIILWEGEKKITLRDFLRSQTRPERVVLLIGPEGGLSLREVERACSEGFRTVSLGHNILRTETAAIIAIGNILYEYGG